jgi:hypothetical protein
VTAAADCVVENNAMAVRALVKMNFAPENTTTPAPSLRG